MIANVLSIAGSDPSGGAGIQADLKTFSALGAYGAAAITALTAQNTKEVRGVQVIDPDFVAAQIDAVFEDLRIDAVKIGMVANAAVAAVIADRLRHYGARNIVLDPVMVAKSGDRLLATDAVAAVRDLLAPLATVITPNLPEAAVLTGGPEATSLAEMRAALPALHRLGARYVLLKGGHLPEGDSTDLLSDGSDVVELPGRRVATGNTHGTGCTLSSAIAALLPLHGPVEAARRAKRYLSAAVENSSRLSVGSGHGPVHHFHALWQEGWAAVTPFSESAWQRTERLRAAIHALPFNTELAAGTLRRERFQGYIIQDALYLGQYSRALAIAGARAPDGKALHAFASSALEAVQVEQALHETYLKNFGVDPTALHEAQASPDCLGYTSFLLAAAYHDPWEVLVAALLPCFWLYWDVGTAITRRADAANPYRAWIDTYADPAFGDAVRTVIGITDRAAEGASAAVRERMMTAFIRSSQYEWLFWDGAYHQRGWPEL